MSGKNKKQRLRRSRKNAKPKTKGLRVQLHESITAPDGRREILNGTVVNRGLPARALYARPIGPQPAPKKRVERIHPPPPPRPPPEKGMLTSPNATYSAGSWVPELNPFTEMEDFARSLVDPIGGKPTHLIMDDDNVPTEAAKTGPYLLNLSISNGTTAADGSTAFILRGDSKATIIRPASISAAHAVTWAGYSISDTYAPYTAQYYARHIMSYVRLRLFCVGDPHRVSISAFRLLGQAPAATVALGCAATNVGCTENQLRAFAGEDSSIADGSVVTFVANQATTTYNRIQFSPIASDRGTNSLAGWCVWLFGLRSTDRVAIDFGSYFEAMSYTDAPMNYNTVGAVRSSGIASDAADTINAAAAGTPTMAPSEDHWEALANKAYRVISAFVGDVASSDRVQRGLRSLQQMWGLVRPFLPINEMAAKIHPGYYSRCSPLDRMREPPPPPSLSAEEEEKDDPPHFEVVNSVPTPRARVRADSLAVPLELKKK